MWGIQIPTNFPCRTQTLLSAPQKHIQRISLTFSRWSRMYDTVAVMQSSICKIFGRYGLMRWLMFFNTMSRLFKIPCWRPTGRTLDKSTSFTAWMTAEWHSPRETEEQRYHVKGNSSLLSCSYSLLLSLFL